MNYSLDDVLENNVYEWDVQKGKIEDSKDII